MKKAKKCLVVGKGNTRLVDMIKDAGYEIVYDNPKDTDKLRGMSFEGVFINEMVKY